MVGCDRHPPATSFESAAIHLHPARTRVGSGQKKSSREPQTTGGEV